MIAGRVVKGRAIPVRSHHLRHRLQGGGDLARPVLRHIQLMALLGFSRTAVSSRYFGSAA
jgi:hypothetical protein